MINLIVGEKGTGKTKILVDKILKAAENADGNLVCIEKGKKLIYDLPHKIRLVDTEEYSVSGYGEFYGFISGLMAGNYDIQQIYVDGTLKTCGQLDGIKDFILKLAKLSDHKVEITFTISADESKLPEEIKQYIVK